MHQNIIYLDHNATTATDKRIIEAIQPYFNIHYSNASVNRQQKVDTI